MPNDRRAPGVDERFEVVGEPRALAADALLGPVHVVDAVARLNRRDDAERRESRLVLRQHDLRVLDARAPVPAAPLLLELRDDVEHHRVRAVADRVHHELEAGGVGVEHRLLELLRRHESAGPDVDGSSA